MLEGLSRERFTMLLTNWYRANRGKFKVPIFAHQELDLHKVFWEVMRRGGFPIVTDQKQWKVRGQPRQYIHHHYNASSNCLGVCHGLFPRQSRPWRPSSSCFFFVFFFLLFIFFFFFSVFW